MALIAMHSNYLKGHFWPQIWTNVTMGPIELDNIYHTSNWALVILLVNLSIHEVLRLGEEDSCFPDVKTVQLMGWPLFWAWKRYRSDN